MMLADQDLLTAKEDSTIVTPDYLALQTDAKPPLLYEPAPWTNPRDPHPIAMQIDAVAKSPDTRDLSKGIAIPAEPKKLGK
jgi:hypothetical protein